MPSGMARMSDPQTRAQGATGCFPQSVPFGPTNDLPALYRFATAATASKPGDCINRNLETGQKSDTLDSSFEPRLPHYGSPFPLAGEQAEPVKPRCMCELVCPVGSVVCGVRVARRTDVII
jgi:hypothetical protein